MAGPNHTYRVNEFSIAARSLSLIELPEMLYHPHIFITKMSKEPFYCASDNRDLKMSTAVSHAQIHLI